VRFSPDGKTVAVDRAGTLVVEETLSGRVVARLHGIAGWFAYLDEATLISLPELAVWKIR
jgi:phage tail protein X